MLTGRARLIAAAAILFPTVIYLGMDTEHHTVLPKEEPNPAYQQADYYIVNGQIRDFSPTGKLKQQLSSTQLEHQPALQQILVTNPEMQIYNAQQPSRKVSSLRGIISDNDDKIVLEGKVLFQDNPDPTQANMLRTESLVILPQENIAKTDQRVTISSRLGVTTSVGMTIDTDSGILNLLSDVTGVYNVN
ncbi:LPS export ABC transporter periplasmic protein LptC [Amphritea sp. 1_MG-2023]|uniref:LPS export ABC transporter periplasmic protein LptC n=1 Tax=Amphritea sp. 1_MG-2023 TaxID=3062670 RepID=UPI0026E3CE56|nr:LPS export ABC transporter periplasmic protein LptC [Amphritea sp. 1_MG-2023]MDO6564062.1 LPS export ABC transporter periplasmic protein LptC [Amphritea sp. 1_MG-2023]